MKIEKTICLPIKKSKILLMWRIKKGGDKEKDVMALRKAESPSKAKSQR